MYCSVQGSAALAMGILIDEAHHSRWLIFFTWMQTWQWHHWHVIATARPNSLHCAVCASLSLSSPLRRIGQACSIIRYSLHLLASIKLDKGYNCPPLSDGFPKTVFWNSGRVKVVFRPWNCSNQPPNFFSLGTFGDLLSVSVMKEIVN